MGLRCNYCPNEREDTDIGNWHCLDWKDEGGVWRAVIVCTKCYDEKFAPLIEQDYEDNQP